MYDASYENPCEGGEVYGYLLLAFVLALVLWPILASVDWVGLYRRACAVEVPVPTPVRRAVSALGRALAWPVRAAASLRAALRALADPEGAARSRLAASLRADLHTGLTRWEEDLFEAELLPAGPGRAAILAACRARPRPSAACVARARARAGKPRVAESAIRRLERGGSLRPNAEFDLDDIVEFVALVGRSLVAPFRR